MVTRAIVVGRGPWGNMFEFSVAFATSILGGYLLLARRYPIRSIGFIPIGVALALLLYASSLPSDDRAARPGAPEPAAADDPRRDGGAVVRDLRDVVRGGRRRISSRGRTTDSRGCRRTRSLDEVAYRAVIIGFPIFATMIILGSWWASIAWSRYWGWDPKETAALVTWLIYAVYLHARNQRSGRGARRRCCWSSASGWCS